MTENKSSKEYFVGVDSDGCVVDSMEVKHKECFCPAFINHFDLQGIAKYARETWEFVNLYSRTRGVNRFAGVIKTIDLLREREEVRERNVSLPELPRLRQWVKNEPKLGLEALEAEIRRNPSPDLQTAYDWSVDVNISIKKLFRNVGLFPCVSQSLERMSRDSDIMVISQTPEKTIVHEWEENGIIQFTDRVLGQEMGSKSAQLRSAAANIYDRNKVLMVGDAPGDYDAAKENGFLFFPIIPGRESESWEELYRSGLDNFFGGFYSGAYEKKLLTQFLDALPLEPSWQ